MSSPPQSRWTLATRHLGWEVRVFDQLESTNTHALSLADDPRLHGLIILARSQSAGRGQYGRVWSAPAQSSVLASLLLFPPLLLRRPVVMTAWAAVAMCDVIERETGLSPQLKWPNDILVNDKKVCGFLIEQRNTGHAESPLATVVGFGLNVTQTASEFASAQLPDAASLSSLTGREFSVDALARAVFHRLDEEYDRLLTGNLSGLESRWQWRFGLVDQPVAAESADVFIRGRLLDLGFDGVMLRNESGVIQLAPEAIRHLRLETA